MAYAYSQKQLDAINRLIAGVHDVVNKYADGERGDRPSLNERLEEVQGLLVYIAENAGVGANINNPQAEQVLLYNGVEWVNSDVPSTVARTSVAYQLNINTTAIRIDDSVNTSYRVYAVKNIGAGDIYIGFASNVTTADGYKLAPNQEYKTTLTSSGTIYGIVASGTGRVSVVRSA